MKKVAIFILIFLIIVASIFSFYLYSIYNTDSAKSENDLALQEKILNNSSWITLKKEDLNGYLNGTYTPNVLSILNSLENAVPVIFQITSNKYSNVDGGIFIIASAFNSNNQVYVYYYNPEINKYEKTVSSLEYILEDATAAFIYNETEGL